MMKLNWKIVLVLTAAVLIGFLLGLTTPIWAKNNDGVLFTATLDQPTIFVSDQDQFVEMRIDGNKEFSMSEFTGTLQWKSPIQYSSVRHENSQISAALKWDRSLKTVSGTWDPVQNITNVVIVTFKIPANTPVGKYELGIKEMKLKEGYDEWEDGTTVSTTLTVAEPTAQSGYTAGLKTTTTAPSVGEQVAVQVTASHTSDTGYAAAELVLTYDSARLSFNKSASQLGAAQVQDTGGSLSLEDYGNEKALNDHIYTLVFDTVAYGDAEITLTSAGFINATGAEKSDLIPAVLAGNTLTVSVGKQIHSVTLPDIFIGNPTVTDGEDYSFSATDFANYDYGTVTATMGGTEVPVTHDGNGSYTVSGVSGPLVISGSRTGKTRAVTFQGNAGEDFESASAVYGTDYSFNLPAVAHWSYQVESIVIGGAVCTNYAIQNGICTIPGSALTGDVVITVTKTQTEAGVLVEGNAPGATQGYTQVAKIGESYTLTVTPETGYTYTVTATMGGKPADLQDNGDNTYTVAKVTGDLVFTVNRTLIVTSLKVGAYLQLNQTMMYLITFAPTLETGKIPCYNGQKMYWSEKYRAYCMLVVSGGLDEEAVAEKLTVEQGEAGKTENTTDVNGSGKTDVSDAQLVHNMYQAMYGDFTADVTLEKFLRADVNGDGKVDTADAAAIVNALLKK